MKKKMKARSNICNDNVLNFRFDNTQTIHSNFKANNTGWFCWTQIVYVANGSEREI